LGTVAVLRVVDNLIDLLGSDVQVSYSGSEVSYADFQQRIVALD
jgi:hypothetical protein